MKAWCGGANRTDTGAYRAWHAKRLNFALAGHKSLRPRTLDMPIDQTVQAPNRRSNRRKGLRCVASLTLPDQSAQRATTMDVGMEGLSVLYARPVAPGTRCHVSFELPLGSRDVSVSAQIKTTYSSYCGAEGFRIGASFITLDPDSTAALAEFMASDV